MGDRVVIVAGAGATLADCMSLPVGSRPPLDRGFFNPPVLKAYATQLAPLRQYVRTHYGLDISSPPLNSLERMMSILYTDVFGGDLAIEAYDAFRRLVQVFLQRLATTTNPVRPTRRSKMYRLLIGFLDEMASPDDLTIVTFNQDLQIEKTLDAIAARRARAGRNIFNCATCYRVSFDGVTTPTGSPPDAVFGNVAGVEGVALLKLHGSMNWYSIHNTPNPSRKALFDPKRKIRLTRRKNIDPSMHLAGASRAKYTFPLVVPPVIHKSGILHEYLKPVWTVAEESLKAADRIVIVGYSCPANDWESANLISRALNSGVKRKEVSLIDPDASVVARYTSLGKLPMLSYFASIDAYLESEIGTRRLSRGAADK